MGPYGYGHELDSMGAVSFKAALGKLQALGAQQPQIAAGAMVPYLRTAQGAALAQQGLFQQALVPAHEKVEAVRGNDVIYGVDSGAAGVGAGVTATLTVAPQKRHVPIRLVMSQNTANAFVVTDIRVGVEPVLATVGAISAAIFVQDATAPDFRAVVCEVGMNFSITVTNITGAAARFTATVVGTYLPWYLGG